MKTKLGSCNPKACRIWLNLELIKKSPASLEYVLVHELVHLLARNHDERFVGLMDQHLPTWHRRRAELNAAPLAKEAWAS
jgi:predicted metal-dependent hydrolase